MLLYLPIAEQTISLEFISILSLAVGFISGLLAIGGGLIMAPLLILYNIAPAIAVSTGSALIVAASLTALPAAFKKSLVDMPLAMLLSGGSICGAILGVVIFNYFSHYGALDDLLTILYVVLLVGLSIFTLYDLIKKYLNRNKVGATPYRTKSNGIFIWDFKISGIKINIFYLIFLGISLGALSAIMGIGGNIILIPITTILLRIDIKVMIHTAMLQLACTAVTVLLFHCIINHSVDIILAICLIVGGTIGSYYGSWISITIKAEYLRFLLFLLITSLAGFFTYSKYIAVPNDYSSKIDDKLSANYAGYFNEGLKDLALNHSVIYALLVLLIAVTISYLVRRALNFIHKR